MSPHTGPTTLIIGATGLVGKSLAHHIRQSGGAVIGTGWSRSGPDLLKLDVRDKAAVFKTLESIRPTTTVVTTALTHVDYCETHPGEARAINVDGMRNVMDACAQAGSKPVFLSTEYVFDGNSGPYTEESLPHPISVYGQTKLEGEKLALQVKEALVIRTTVVYDWDKDSKNFVMSLVRTLKEGNPLRVPMDQWSHPTLARNLSTALWEFITEKRQGIYNMAGPDYVPRHEFALEAARIFGFDEKWIQPVPTTQLRQAAPRPLKAGILNRKAQALLKIPLLGIKEGLLLVKKDWDADAGHR